MTLLRFEPRLRRGRSLAPSDLPPPILGSASRGVGCPLTRGTSKGAPIWSGQMKMKIEDGILDVGGEREEIRMRVGR